MRKPNRKSFLFAVGMIAAAFVLASSGGAFKSNAAIRPLPSIPYIYAQGLNNPRGLKFGPDGNLYVAEGGVGGNHTTLGECEQVPFPIGPYLGSSDGSRISKIDSHGVRTTVADHLPSSQTSAAMGNLVSGVADIAFIENTLYAVLGGAGCSHGVSKIPNGIIRVNPNGSTTLIADLSAFQNANPVRNPEPDDFEPDGTWYSLIAVRGDLYALEPNHGELDKITTSGEITRVTDISATEGHIVPTALAYHGNFYVGNLNHFPIVDGSSKIIKITPSGNTQDAATGFTTVLGLVFDDRDRMYVLENTTGNPFPTPFSGRIVRVDPNGHTDVIASNLSLPTGMTLGPDGDLYVSSDGFGPFALGGGEILRIEVR